MRTKKGGLWTMDYAQWTVDSGQWTVSGQDCVMQLEWLEMLVMRSQDICLCQSVAVFVPRLLSFLLPLFLPLTLTFSLSFCLPFILWYMLCRSSAFATFARFVLCCFLTPSLYALNWVQVQYFDLQLFGELLPARQHRPRSRSRSGHGWPNWSRDPAPSSTPASAPALLCSFNCRQRCPAPPFVALFSSVLVVRYGCGLTQRANEWPIE